MGEAHTHHFWSENYRSIQTLTKAVRDSLVKTHLNVCGLLLTNSLISGNEEELLSNVPPKHPLNDSHRRHYQKGHLVHSFTAELIWIWCIWIALFWLASLDWRCVLHSSSMWVVRAGPAPGVCDSKSLGMETLAHPKYWWRNCFFLIDTQRKLQDPGNSVDLITFNCVAPSLVVWVAAELCLFESLPVLFLRLASSNWKHQWTYVKGFLAYE